MAGLNKLIALASHKSDSALATWQRLKKQCDEALMKLSLLKQHRERYREMLRSGLGEGMPAMATMAYLGFIGQIDEVVLRQESEVGRLDQACARQWQELIETRREKRMYEIVHERAASRELAAALRRSQAEIDDLLQRVGKSP
ncbi:MAG TPA: flagellar export protein FliJ [Stellaceae bacterium]|jgi:flagellar export protein FliJ